MGLGTKIKEAIHGDKDTQHSPTSTSHKTTTGSHPNDAAVPRTHKDGALHNDSTIHSAGEPRTEKLHGEKTHGRHSPDYTYGSGKDSSLTGTGSHGVGHHGGVSPTTGSSHTAGVNNTTDVPHSGTTGTTGSHHNKLQKDVPPYWGEQEAGVGGTHGRSHNDGLTDSNHGVTGSNNHGAAGMAGAGAAGMAGSHHMSGSDGNTHGAPGMTGSNTHGSGMTGNNHGTPGMMTGATGTNDRYDDRINPGVPTTGGMNTGATTGTGSSGIASNLTHRPADNSNIVRDHKVHEYDAPTNSSGRGKQGLAGAAGGVAASELAHRHHKDDMRDYNTPTSGTSPTDRGLNTAERWHNTSGVADPAMSNTTGQHGMTGHNNSGVMLDSTGTTTHGDHMGGARSGSMGNNYTSLLDPHNTTSRTTYGHDSSHPSHGMMGGNNHVTDSRVGGDNMGTTHGAPGMIDSNRGLGGNNHDMIGSERGMTGKNHGNSHGAGMAGAGMAAGAAAGAMVGSHGNNHGSHGSHGMTGSDGMIGPNDGMTGNTHGDNTIRAVPHQDNMGGNMTRDGMGSNISPSHHNNPLSGSHSTGMGDGHMGPGHAAAKVMHRCTHCGNDNDISKYFSKEAVYRMS